MNYLYCNYSDYPNQRECLVLSALISSNQFNSCEEKIEEQNCTKKCNTKMKLCILCESKSVHKL